MIFIIVPLSAPINIITKSLSQSTITLEWQPPPVWARNGVIITYRISYQSLFFNRTTTYVDGSQLSVMLRSLRPYTAYNITLAAATMVGYGPESPIITETTSQAGILHSFFNILMQSDMVYKKS